MNNSEIIRMFNLEDELNGNPEKIIMAIENVLSVPLSLSEFKASKEFSKEFNKLIDSLKNKTINYDCAKSLIRILNCINNTLLVRKETFHQYMMIIKSQNITIDYNGNEFLNYYYLPYFKLTNVRIKRFQILKWIKDNILDLLKNETYIEYAKHGYSPEKIAISGYVLKESEKDFYFNDEEGFYSREKDESTSRVVSVTFIQYVLYKLQKEDLTDDDRNSMFKSFFRVFTELSFRIQSKEVKALKGFNNRYEVFDENVFEDELNVINKITEKKYL